LRRGSTPIDDLQAYGADLRKEHERRVAQGVAASGHSETRIARIPGDNFIRYAGEIWGADAHPR
jgi:hypothetical protein